MIGDRELEHLDPTLKTGRVDGVSHELSMKKNLQEVNHILANVGSALGQKNDPLASTIFVAMGHLQQAVQDFQNMTKTGI